MSSVPARRASRLSVIFRSAKRLGLLVPLLAVAVVPSGAAMGRPPAAAAAPAPVAALAHFDHLFAETRIAGETVGVLNIYSEAPDFHFAIEPREGYACVDDAARALVLLAALPKLPPEQMRQMELMTRFVLQMQADNGYFHNFIWSDGRINRDYRTSVAELSWWSLRALWGLEAVLTRLAADSELAARARKASDRLVANLQHDLPARQTLDSVEGVSLPTWLPYGSGADAASTAALGLARHYQRTGDAGTRALLVRLGEGMTQMRAGDAKSFPYGAHLSWRNEWHGWGNAQAYALLRLGKLLGRKDFIASGLAEVDHFYPFLLEHGMLARFSVRQSAGKIEQIDSGRFPQIAYGLSPMILASMEAYHQTRRGRYRKTARALASWFSGTNDARQPIYDAASGRVLDGIDAPLLPNPNAGAESTVEGLLSFVALSGTSLP